MGDRGLEPLTSTVEMWAILKKQVISSISSHSYFLDINIKD